MMKTNKVVVLCLVINHRTFSDSECFRIEAHSNGTELICMFPQHFVLCGFYLCSQRPKTTEMKTTSMLKTLKRRSTFRSHPASTASTNLVATARSVAASMTMVAAKVVIQMAMMKLVDLQVLQLLLAQSLTPQHQLPDMRYTVILFTHNVCADSFKRAQSCVHCSTIASFAGGSMLYNSASDDDEDDLEDAAAGEASDADDHWFEGAEPVQPSLEYHYPLEEYTAEGDEEDEEEVFEGALLDMPAERQFEAGEKRRTGRYGRTAGKQLPPYIETLLGRANSALMAGRTDVALAALKESIRQAPEAPQSYQSLAAYAADIGNHQLELEVNMCMCGLNKKVSSSHAALST
jgi:hypothetical protein